MDSLSIVAVLVRWVHISCAVIVVGTTAAAVDLYRKGRLKGPPWTPGQMIPVIIALIVSGLYQFMNRLPGATPAYHAVFGIKFLLALHVIAVGLIAAKPAVDDAKRTRLLTGVAISGFTIVLLGAILKSL